MLLRYFASVVLDDFDLRPTSDDVRSTSWLLPARWTIPKLRLKRFCCAAACAYAGRGVPFPQGPNQDFWQFAKAFAGKVGKRFRADGWFACHFASDREAQKETSLESNSTTRLALSCELRIFRRQMERPESFFPRTEEAVEFEPALWGDGLLRMARAERVT